MRQSFSKLKTTAMLLLLSAPIILLVGCRSKEAGGGFDILLFLQNPIVMVVAGILIAFYMFNRSK